MPLFTSTRNFPPCPESDAVNPPSPVPPGHLAVPGPTYHIPPPPGHISVPAPKVANADPAPTTPLMILLVRDETNPEKVREGLKGIGEALASGGAVAIDTNCLDPLILFYGGHVIRFDEYDTEAPERSAPKQERQTPASERETW